VNAHAMGSEKLTVGARDCLIEYVRCILAVLTGRGLCTCVCVVVIDCDGRRQVCVYLCSSQSLTESWL
jgi:hypothetical protein